MTTITMEKHILKRLDALEDFAKEIRAALAAPATAPDELERKPSAKEVAWDRVRRSLVVRNAQITIGEVADTMDCQLNDAMKGTP